jgi:hypothetical protein
VHLVFYRGGCFYDRKWHHLYMDGYTDARPENPPVRNVEEAMFRQYYLD